MEQQAIDAAARALMDARENHQTMESYPDGAAPQSLEDAYQVQDALVALLCAKPGVRVAGYKVGATNAPALVNFGLDAPFRGLLLSDTILSSPGVISTGSYFNRIVECEIAFRMADDLPAAAAPYDLDAVMAAVASIFISIELVDSRFAAGFVADGKRAVADNGYASYWIQGREFTDFSHIDLTEVSVGLRVDGEEVCRGVGANVLEEDPSHSLAWLANDLCANGGGLKAGDIVTAGSLIPPTPVPVDLDIVADFGDLGEVGVRFEG